MILYFYCFKFVVLYYKDHIFHKFGILIFIYKCEYGTFLLNSCFRNKIVLVNWMCLKKCSAILSKLSIKTCFKLLPLSKKESQKNF